MSAVTAETVNRSALAASLLANNRSAKIVRVDNV